MDVELARWLISPQGTEALAWAGSLSGELARRVKRLRESLSPEQAAAVLQQVELRERARTKFTAAERMFFTPTGLEQATDERIAQHKAERFRGRRQVYDLCTGIGGDLIALTAVSPTTGHDLNDTAAVFAQANVAVAIERHVEVTCSDVTTLDLSQCEAWHLDPDRRPDGRRTTRVELHEPSADAISTLLSRNDNAAIKLAPAATWPQAWTARAEWEWISQGRQCRQLVAWFGDLAREPGKRRATLVTDAGVASASMVGEAGVSPRIAAGVQRFVFEPDVAVLAAQLVGALAERHGLAALASGASYLTGESEPDDPLVSCFEVEEVLPLDLKKLKSHLAERNVGHLEVKVRGVDLDPVQVRKRLAPRGSAAKTLLLTRVGARHVAIVARRAGSSSPRS